MTNRTYLITTSVLLIALASIFVQCSPVKQSITDSKIPSEIIELYIKPSTTDRSITNTDVPHLIMYDSTLQHNKLLLFLPGTNGIPAG